MGYQRRVHGIIRIVFFSHLFFIMVIFSLSHPIRLRISLIIMAILARIITFSINSSWFFYLIILVFLGGVIILIIYISTLAGGKSGGQTAGIVIGVMFAIVVVMGGAYYVNQNGIPFIAAQTSFGNINSADNTEGIADGISNPLDNIDGNDDDNSSNGADDSGNVEVEVEQIMPVAAATSGDSNDIFNLAVSSSDPAATDTTMTAVSLDTPGDSLI